MSTALQDLLAWIEPIPADVERRVDAALNEFVPPGAAINGRAAFDACLATFFRDLELVLLSARPHRPANVPFDVGRRFRLLEREYGRGGIAAAFDLARTGSEGGLRRMLTRLGQAVGREHAGNQIETVVSFYWRSRAPQELVADSADYVTLYSQILPSEMTEGGAVRLRVSFFDVLCQHPFAVQRVSQGTPWRMPATWAADGMR